MVTRRAKSEVVLSDAKIMSFIDGYNFWYGPDYGPPETGAAFLNAAEKERTWNKVKDQLVQLIEQEAEQDSVGQWRYRGSYLPWGVSIESIDAYWQYDRKEPMPWPKPERLNEKKI
jgi:hypothetical protein